MKYLLIILCVFLNLDCIAQSNFENPNSSHYTGLIDKFPIEMELNNNVGQLSGWYHYPNKSIKLKLNGTLSNDKQIKLFEYNHKGDVTGIFEGEINELGEIKGQWYNPDKTKTLSFYIMLNNDISLLTLSEQKNIEQKSEKKMYQPSKIKGFSKLALGVVIGLVLLLGLLIFYLSKTKKKLKEKPAVIHTKEVQREVHFVNDSTDPNFSLEVKKGELFQKYVVEMFLTKKDFFEWVDKTPDTKYGEHYPKSNHNPDLIIKFKNKKQGWEEEIAVECKYRAGDINNEVFIDEQRKLDNYKRFQSEKGINTFMALGYGGLPDSPKKIFVLPIDKVSSNMKVEDLELYNNKKTYFFYDYNNKTLS